MTSLLPSPVDRAPAPVALDRALLISIQPRYADAILSGAKTLELRRTRPTLDQRALALIYSSTPVKAVVGWARVADIVQDSPRELWRRHHATAGVTQSEFNNYFDGTDQAFGIRLTHVQAATAPMSLGQLRDEGLEPPQSWRYVDACVAQRFLRRLSGR